MVDHASLIPTFRDFRTYFIGESEPVKDELPKPTVLEVERILRESPAGRLNQAVNLEGWPWLQRLEFLDAVIPGIRVHSLGGIAPFQADGIWGPYEWYYRERGGYAALRLAPIATFPSAQESLYSSEAEVREFAGSGGWLTRFLQLWERLERSAYLYEFPAREVHLERTDRGIVPVVTGKSTTQAGWGHTPEEAWLNAGVYVSYFDEHFGWTRELQERRRELMEISRIPLGSDRRVYPGSDPDFSVHWDALSVPDELASFL